MYEELKQAWTELTAAGGQFEIVEEEVRVRAPPQGVARRLSRGVVRDEADDGARRVVEERGEEAPGQEKRATFQIPRLSVVSHSFRLTFGRAIISRGDLDACPARLSGIASSTIMLKRR